SHDQVKLLCSNRLPHHGGRRFVGPAGLELSVAGLIFSDAGRVLVALVGSFDACRVLVVPVSSLTRAGWRGPDLLLGPGSAPCAPNTASPCSSAHSGSFRLRLAQARKSPRPPPATRPAALFCV